MHGGNLTEVQVAAIIHRLSENRNISFAFLLVTTLLPSWGAWIYDVANQLYLFCHHLTGPTLSQGSIISELMRVTDVIKRLSPLYEEEYEAGVDWEESRIRKVLDGEGSAEERAIALCTVCEK